LKIYVIDNGGQWTHRIWRTLCYLNVNAEVVPELKTKVDGIVLSGGPMRMSSTDINCDYFDLNIPILGICAGHQYIAKYFGGKVMASKTPEYGQVQLTILKEDALLANIPKTSIVWASHNDEVTKISKDLVRLAESPNCRVQALKHKTKPFYGVQFHPEVEHTEYGEQMFKNFIGICKNY
jgi:GMP synthase (glutamine-hydrolysing)